jgi:hypothetical protein
MKNIVAFPIRRKRHAQLARLRRWFCNRPDLRNAHGFRVVQIRGHVFALRK